MSERKYIEPSEEHFQSLVARMPEMLREELERNGYLVDEERIERLRTLIKQRPAIFLEFQKKLHRLHFEDMAAALRFAREFWDGTYAVECGAVSVQ